MPRCLAYTSNRPNRDIEFIENIEQDEWHGKWGIDEIYYDVIANCRTLPLRKVRKALNYAMTSWDIEIDVTFKPKWYDRKGNDTHITVDFKSSEEDDLFKERPGVLAYAYFPSQGNVDGVMVFNDDYIWSMDGKSITTREAFENGWIDGFDNPDNLLKTYNIIHVLMHELGHSLGLRHDVSGNTDGRDVMDAFYSGILELSDRDIVRILLKYPRRVFSRWSHYARLKKTLYRMKRRF
jgi:hypothetical protein